MIIEAMMLLFASGSVSEPREQPMIPAFFTGERLYEICAGPNEGQCWMYVAGVIDGLFQAETGLSKRTICRSEITNREAAQHVTNYLRDNEGIRRNAAAVAVKLALESELPCTGEEA